MKKRFLDFIPLITNKTKIKISFCLLIIAVVMCIIRPDSLDSKMCFVAMLFSFGGDISLNGTPLDKRPRSLMYLGAVLFMIAHIVYASGYYLLIQNNPLVSFVNPGLIIACIFMVSLLFVSIICVKISKQSLGIPMIVVFGFYIFIIGINFVTICSYSWSFKAISFIGALSFLISDFIIGVETVFGIKSDILRKLVWIFYPIGQFLIIVSR